MNLIIERIIICEQKVSEECIKFNYLNELNQMILIFDDLKSF